MKSKALGTLALGAAFIAGVALDVEIKAAAFGYCAQPYAPSAYLSKPSKPFCASSGGCEDWEIQSYRRQIDSYFDDLRRYAREVDEYYDDAGRYIKCMSELD